MNQLLYDLHNYLYITLNISIEPKPFEDQVILPSYITDFYNLFGTYIFGRLCLLMVDKEPNDIAPGVIQNHMMTIDVSCGSYIVIYVQSAICFQNQKLLIEKNVPFIIPGKQMYLPHFNVDLMENFKKIRKKKKKDL